MKNITLTEAQKTALRAVSATNFQTSRIIGANPSALRALARKGLVEGKWAEGSIRRDGTWSYRITGRGVAALHKLNREKYNEPRPITAIPSGHDRHGNQLARRTYVIDRRPEPFGNGNSRIFFEHKSRLDGMDHFIPHVVVTDSIEFEPKPTASNLAIGQRVVITYADDETFHGEVYEIGHDAITVTNGKASRQAWPDQVSPA
jgi:hypothetical protein